MDLRTLAAALYPYLKELVEQPVCEHQYVLTGTPRRNHQHFETLFTYEFFCERCLDVKVKTKHVAGSHTYWT